MRIQMKWFDMVWWSQPTDMPWKIDVAAIGGVFMHVFIITMAITLLHHARKPRETHSNEQFCIEAKN